MFDKSAPTSVRALQELAKASVRKTLERYALWRTGDPDVGKDVLGRALMLALDPEKKPWDSEKRSFFSHMRRVMDDLVIEDARTGPGRFEVNETRLAGKGGEHGGLPDPADDGPLPDDARSDAHQLASHRGLGAALVERLRGRDDVAVAVFGAACLYDEPAEQAAHLGLDVADVYEAHRRLRYHASILKNEWQAAEDRRMADLRRASEKRKKKGTPS